MKYVSVTFDRKSPISFNLTFKTPNDSKLQADLGLTLDSVNLLHSYGISHIPPDEPVSRDGNS